MAVRTLIVLNFFKNDFVRQGFLLLIIIIIVTKLHLNTRWTTWIRSTMTIHMAICSTIMIIDSLNVFFVVQPRINMPIALWIVHVTPTFVNEAKMGLDEVVEPLLLVLHLFQIFSNLIIDIIHFFIDLL